MNIGLLGCSSIAESAILGPASKMSDVRVRAVASRDAARGRAYSLTHGVEQYVHGYEALLRRDDIDSVYVSVPNSMHGEWVVRAAHAGKHVLVEKPICTSSDDGAKVALAPERYSVYVLEAIMVQHHPWQEYVRELVASAVFGRLRHIESRICHQLDRTRVRGSGYRFEHATGGGVLLDEGPYWLQFLQCVVGLRVQSMACTSVFDHLGGCDLTTNAHLHLDRGVTADFVASFEAPYEATHRLFFDEGVVRISNFFRASLGAYKVTIRGAKTGCPESIMAAFPPQNYYANQLRHFVGAARGTLRRIPVSASIERVSLLIALSQTALRPQDCRLCAT